MPVAILEKLHGMHQQDMTSPLADPIFLLGDAQNHGCNLPITIITSSSRDTVHPKLDMEAVVIAVVRAAMGHNGEATNRPAFSNLKITLTTRRTIKANMLNNSASL